MTRSHVAPSISLSRNKLNSEVCLKVQINAGRRAFTLGAILVVLAGSTVGAQTSPVTRIDLPIGRAFPLTTSVGITRVSIANPAVADVIVVGTRELVINALGAGETDALVWLSNGTRQHYRVSVHSPSDRMQIALYIKIAEVRRDVLRNAGVSWLYRGSRARVGTETFRTDNPFNPNGGVTLPEDAGFATVLTDLGTKNLLALVDLEETRGNARTLAEPNLVAGNKDTATFLAGGELPIPVLQPGDGGNRVSIQYKEFGVRLQFIAEILSDNLIRLQVTPEVSSLDFVNGITISGFNIPAFRTRRVSTTVDVPKEQSMIISGLFSNEQERVKSGVPFLQDLPVIGHLFSSTRWQSNDNELLVIVHPVIIDPSDPRPQDILRLRPDTALPAREAIRPRLEGGMNRPPSPIIR